jgi:hypothetical protein
MPLGDRLERRAVEALAGRRAELERLEAFALGNEPLVMHIQGIPGIGKTHLLNALAASIGGRVFVARLDARWCEPSPAALCRAICREIGASESEDSAVVATSLSHSTKRTLLVLDSYESFRLLDSWLRQVFLPSLGDSVRTILSSREPPRPAWRIAPAWRGLFDSMLLETFSPEVALEYLTSEGVPAVSARDLNRIARGHPLALSLGSALHSAGGQVRGSQPSYSCSQPRRGPLILQCLPSILDIQSSLSSQSHGTCGTTNSGLLMATILRVGCLPRENWTNRNLGMT